MQFKSLLISGILLISISFSYSQSTYQYTIGNSSYTIFVEDVLENTNGNNVIGGPFTPSELVFAEVTPSGTIVNSKSIVNTNHLLERLIQTTDGGYLACGSYLLGQYRFWYALKMDVSFNIQWHKRYGEDFEINYLNWGEEISPGRYLLSGSSSGKSKMIVLDNAGNIVYQKSYGNSQHASSDHRAKLIAPNEIALTSLINSVNIVDTSGNILKQSTLNFASYVSDVVKIPGIGYAAIGGSSITAPGVLFFAVLDSNLTTIISTIGVAIGGNVHPRNMTVDQNGNCYIALTLENGLLYKAALMKISSSGNVLWLKTYLPGMMQESSLMKLNFASDGGILLSGSTGMNNPDFSTPLVIKVDTAGNSCYQGTHPFSIIPNNFVTTPVPGILSNTFITYPDLTDTLSYSAQVVSVLCSTTGLQNDFHQQSGIVYPTIFSEQLTFELPGNNRFGVVVFDSYGRKVIEKQISNPEVLNTTGLSNGMYLVKIFSDQNHFEQVQKVIKR